MVFSSLTFLYAFLPLVLLVTFVAPRSARNALLLAASLLFYAWGERGYVLLMLGSIALNYVAGLVVDRRRGRGTERAVLLLFVGANLALLAAFKYANFAVDNANALLGLELELAPVHLPIGISFFTFQALSYLVDVHRGEARAQRNPLNVALYVSMFPQLVAGPIVRYHDVARQITRRVVTRAGFALGIRRFVVGLGKKILLANVLGRLADEAFALEAAELSGPVAWAGVVAYAFQIYFDFSGYSDMAIGLGHMLGFRFLENFRHPYVARSLQDFWRRWHVSLSTWFRDYLYVPLGGNRVAPWRVYLNLFTVFFLCGLWHGASWNFALWGLLHGTFLVLERLGLGRVLVRLPRAVGHAYTLLVVLLSWVLFRAETLTASGVHLSAMFLGGAPDALPLSTFLDRELALAFLVALFASTPIAAAIGRRMALDTERQAFGPGLLRLGTLAGVFACTLLYLVAGTFDPFIYFRF